MAMDVIIIFIIPMVLINIPLTLLTSMTIYSLATSPSSSTWPPGGVNNVRHGVGRGGQGGGGGEERHLP